MRIRCHKLQDYDYGDQWLDEVQDRWDYEDFRRDERWRRGWISMDCALYNPGDDRVYLGITSFDADIFRAFDRRTGRFLDLGYAAVADPFDAKFHRSLVHGPDGAIYGAIALLHDVDRHFEAPGGAIVRYDPADGSIRKLCVPQPHVYIQAMAADCGRGLLYCMCFPPERFISYSLRTGEVRDLGLIGTGIGGMAQGENLAFDDDGCVWLNWQLTRAWQNSPGVDAARLCKYDPRLDRIVFYRTGLPHPDRRPGYAKAEAFFNFGDGFIYASGAAGSLYRIDPQGGRATFLFTPTTDRPSRLSSMVRTGDGAAFGVTGRGGRCELMRVDYRRGTFEKLGEIRDEAGNSLWQCHDIAAAPDGTLYVCENDDPYRSGYLWEIVP